MAQSAAITGSDTDHLVSNPDNPAQSWLTLALARTCQTIVDWLEVFPTEASAEKLALNPAEIDWSSVARAERFGLQDIQVAWTLTSLLAQQVPPSSSDQALADQMRREVSEFSAHLHAWVGLGARKILGPVQALLDEITCPPAPLQALLDLAVLRDHVVSPPSAAGPALLTAPRHRL